MAKKAAWFILAAIGMLILAPVTLAQTSGGAAPEGIKWVGVAAAIALGIAAAACGIGQGKATASACESIARNPGAGGAIRIIFIIGVALIESLTLYVLVVVLIEIFVVK